MLELDLVTRRFADLVTVEAFLPGLEKHLTPLLVQIRCDPLSSAQRGDALSAAQSLKNDPNPLLGRRSTGGPPPDLADCSFARMLLPWRHSTLS